jgi:toxin ParE1/3/4
MLKLVYSPLAKHDLMGIHTWSVREFGEGQAGLYAREIVATLRRAAEVPGILRDASEVRPGLLKLNTGSHISFVRLVNDELRVIRILHGRMDPERWM